MTISIYLLIFCSLSRVFEGRNQSHKLWKFYFILFFDNFLLSICPVLFLSLVQSPRSQCFILHRFCQTFHLFFSFALSFQSIFYLLTHHLHFYFISIFNFKCSFLFSDFFFSSTLFMSYKHNIMIRGLRNVFSICFLCGHISGLIFCFFLTP